jgi:hypothetical protein
MKFLVVFIIENSIKLQKMVLKGKISLVTSSQWLYTKCAIKFTRNGPPWLVMELGPNRKLFPDHLPSIFHGVLVGSGSLWPA